MPRRYYNISYPAHLRAWYTPLRARLNRRYEERNVTSEEIERNVSGHANETYRHVQRDLDLSLSLRSLVIELNSNLSDVSIRERHRRRQKREV